MFPIQQQVEKIRIIGKLIQYIRTLRTIINHPIHTLQKDRTVKFQTKLKILNIFKIIKSIQILNTTKEITQMITIFNSINCTFSNCSKTNKTNIYSTISLIILLNQIINKSHNHFYNKIKW